MYTFCAITRDALCFAYPRRRKAGKLPFKYSKGGKFLVASKDKKQEGKPLLFLALQVLVAPFFLRDPNPSETNCLIRKGGSEARRMEGWYIDVSEEPLNTAGLRSVVVL